MSMRSKDPGTPGGCGVAVWEYLKVEAGQTLHGWLAGQPFGCDVHHVGQSKVCRRGMSDGALPCRYCGPEHPVLWRGYTPLFDADYRRRFVLIGADILPLVREIEPGAMVEIQRMKGQKQRILIRPKAWRVTPLPPEQARQCPVDILPALFRVWGDAELAAWHAATAPASVPPVATPKRAYAPPADLEAAREVGEAEMEKVKNRLLGRFKVAEVAAGIGADPEDKPHRNGKPKPR